MPASVAMGSPVGTVRATPQQGRTLTYAITGGNEGAHFAIGNALTGEITVADAAWSGGKGTTHTLTVDGHLDCRRRRVVRGRGRR